ALRALEQAQKKSRNRTNRLLRGENLHHDQILAKASPEARLWSTKAPPQSVEMVGGRVRAKVAARILNPTAPNTGSGGGIRPSNFVPQPNTAFPSSLVGRGPVSDSGAVAGPSEDGLGVSTAPMRVRGVPDVVLKPTSPNAGRIGLALPTCPPKLEERRRKLRPVRRSAQREGGRSEGRWGDCPSRSPPFARSPPRCLEPGRRMTSLPWHRLGSRAILPAKYVKYGGETCAHSNT